MKKGQRPRQHLRRLPSSNSRNTINQGVKFKSHAGAKRMELMNKHLKKDHPNKDFDGDDVRNKDDCVPTDKNRQGDPLQDILVKLIFKEKRFFENRHKKQLKELNANKKNMSKEKFNARKKVLNEKLKKDKKGIQKLEREVRQADKEDREIEKGGLSSLSKALPREVQLSIIRDFNRKQKRNREDKLIRKEKIEEAKRLRATRLDKK